MWLERGKQEVKAKRMVGRTLREDGSGVGRYGRVAEVADRWLGNQ